MNKKKTLGKRLAAIAGVLTIGLAGLAGPASADDDATAPAPSPVSINPNATGSITVNKHVDDADQTPGVVTGDPLEGVGFKLEKVVCTPAIDLTTAEGWDIAEGIYESNSLPTGCQLVQQGDEQTTNAVGKTVFGELGLGVYLVTETSSGNNLITAKAAPYWVTVPNPENGAWVYDVDTFPKNVLGTVNPTKTVGTPDKPADIELGAIVPFTIEAPVATPSLPYVSFSITDALSAGLEFVSWSDISIGGVALAAADYTVSADNTTVTLTSTGIAKLNAAAAVPDGTTVSAVIKAEVTDLGKLDNKASVSINGTPGDTPEVTTNWARLDINKYEAGKTSEKLAGATFELWNADKTTLLATGTTDSTGKLSFVVWVGNNADTTEVVYLKETVAPQGYVLPADPWTGPITLTSGVDANASITVSDIANKKPSGPELPLTGAAGTLLMTIGGAALVLIGGGVAVVARKRNNA